MRDEGLLSFFHPIVTRNLHVFSQVPSGAVLATVVTRHGWWLLCRFLVRLAGLPLLVTTGSAVTSNGGSVSGAPRADISGAPVVSPIHRLSAYPRQSQNLVGALAD